MASEVDSVVEVRYEEVFSIPSSGTEHTVISIKPVNIEDLKKDLKEENSTENSNENSNGSSTGSSTGSDSGSGGRIKLGRKINTKRRR